MNAPQKDVDPYAGWSVAQLEEYAIELRVAAESEWDALRIISLEDRAWSLFARANRLLEATG